MCFVTFFTFVSFRHLTLHLNQLFSLSSNSNLTCKLRARRSGLTPTSCLSNVSVALSMKLPLALPKTVKITPFCGPGKNVNFGNFSTSRNYIPLTAQVENFSSKQQYAHTNAPAPSVKHTVSETILASSYVEFD